DGGPASDRFATSVAQRDDSIDGEDQLKRVVRVEIRFPDAPGVREPAWTEEELADPLRLCSGPRTRASGSAHFDAPAAAAAAASCLSQRALSQG
ncbi:MAG: hypothetical protein K0S65_5472, partial [Labilithrix sp.]|nr:hypothetical protein [Labilithrix sp.]